MVVSRLEYLFKCYVYHNCTIEEEEELMVLLSKSENEATIRVLIEEFMESPESEIQMPGGAATAVLQSILQKDKGRAAPLKNKNPQFVPWIRVAAAAMLLIVGGALWRIVKKDKKDSQTDVAPVAEKHSVVSPGGDHAFLTMSDGSTIVLDSIRDGKFQQGNTKINKQNGVLIYRASASSKSTAPVSFNTLTTPRGGEYQVVLPDGSKVWLNAASSLHFPTAFAGNQREVELTGEAYFEVTRNKDKPFRVKVGDMRINVLGTQFNVNAYADADAIKASLLEGSIKITKGNTSDLLRPGEQAVLNKKGDGIEIRNPDMEEVIAWKNGLFQFDGADISTIMRQIGRWYDVEIVYAGKPPERRFEGKISREAQLSDVLKILELSTVKFTVEGKRIIVQ